MQTKNQKVLQKIAESKSYVSMVREGKRIVDMTVRENGRLVTYQAEKEEVKPKSPKKRKSNKLN